MELGSYFLFLQELIKDIIIIIKGRSGVGGSSMTNTSKAGLSDHRRQGAALTLVRLE